MKKWRGQWKRKFRNFAGERAAQDAHCRDDTPGRLSRPDPKKYPLGHRIKESWGRAVVEAMLTGCVPLVPVEHQFHKLLVHGESGFICREFREFKEAVWELYENFPYRQKISRQCAGHARECLCNPEEHRMVWIGALTF